MQGSYLGDGVYCHVDAADQIWLRTERETGWHEIALDPATFAALVAYAAQVWPQVEEHCND
jgi:hypothetical protein